MAKSTSPCFEFNIKQGGCQNDIVDLKIKLKNKNNPNYIKLLGMMKIPMPSLITMQSENSSAWFPLYSLKKGTKESSKTPEEMSSEPIGQINLEFVFQ